MWILVVASSQLVLLEVCIQTTYCMYTTLSSCCYISFTSTTSVLVVVAHLLVAVASLHMHQMNAVTVHDCHQPWDQLRFLRWRTGSDMPGRLLTLSTVSLVILGSSLTR